MDRRASTQLDPSCARSNANAHEAADRLPLSTLSADDYEEIIALALAAGKWSLLSRAAHDRALLEESRQTQSNVTSLLVERRRRA